MSTKRVKAAADKRIEIAYRERCQNIEIPIMLISKIFERGRDVIARGANDQELGDEIYAFVIASGGVRS